MSLLEFLQAQKYSSSGRVHVAPNIPKKLLSNALSAYGLTVDPSEVVVLIDDTMFASGKDGCLIGQQYLAIRESFSDAVAYAYDEVDALELKGSKLFLNKRQAIAFNMPDKDDLHDCFSLVQEWLRTRGGEQSAPLAKPAAVKASAGNQELSAEQVDSIVQMTLSLAERLGLERVYVRPHIPQKKLSAALESYGANMSADEVLVLIDDTLFGGAKEGVLMGESKLAVKMVFDTPRLFFWRHLDSLAVEKRDLFVNSRKVGTFTQVGEKELGEFFSVINEALGDARRGLAAQPLVAVAQPAVAVLAPKPEAEPALVEPVAEEILALAVIEETSSDDPQKKVSGKDKLLGYVAVAIEQNKSKILPFIKDKTGEASLAALRDDSNVEKLGGFIYAFLPGVVRLALKEETFVRFVLDNRNKLLDKLLAGEAERVAALQDITPAAQLAPAYHAELDDLLMDDEPVVQPGLRAIEKMQAILADLKQEQRDDPDSAVIWQLPINYLGAVIPKAKKLIGCPDEEIEEQIFYVMAFMYGFSFHKIPESIRQQDGLLEGFLTGFLMVCENYQERSPHSKVRPEDDQMLMAMAMAKMATKQQLNEMVRKLLDEHKGGAKPGDFEVDDIMLLLREANGFAQQWVDNLTREIIAEERALQNKWGDLLN